MYLTDANIRGDGEQIWDGGRAEAAGTQGAGLPAGRTRYNPLTLAYQEASQKRGFAMNKDVQGLIYGASIVSIITAIYMYATGKKDTGIFIGLWAPTFLSLGTFYNTENRVAKDESAA